MRRRLAFIVTTLAALAAVRRRRARRGSSPATPVDGPSADIRSVGDVDIARDGTGAVAYVQRDGGVDHIFVSRLAGGVWQAPERVDVGLDAPASTPAVAASDGGRLAVVFIAGGSLVRRRAPGRRVRPGAPPQLIGQRCGRLRRSTCRSTARPTRPTPSTATSSAPGWTAPRPASSPLTAPLDIDPAAVAGDGSEPLARGDRGRRHRRRGLGRGRPRLRAAHVRHQPVERRAGPDIGRPGGSPGRRCRRARRRHRGRLVLRVGRLPPAVRRRRRRQAACDRRPAARLARRSAGGLRRPRLGRPGRPGARGRHQRQGPGHRDGRDDRRLGARERAQGRRPEPGARARRRGRADPAGRRGGRDDRPRGRLGQPRRRHRPRRLLRRQVGLAHHPRPGARHGADRLRISARSTRRRASTSPAIAPATSPSRSSRAVATRAVSWWPSTTGCPARSGSAPARRSGATSSRTRWRGGRRWTSGGR